MGLTTQKNYRLFLFVNSFVIVLLGASIAGWGVFWLFPANLGEGYHNVQSLVREIQNVLFWRVTILYAVTSFFIVLAMAVLHLLYSHRIAGPAYRIGREAARIGQGNLTGNIKFRQKDNLTDMADSLNDVASQYRGRIDAIKNRLAIIDARSKTVADLLQRGTEGVEFKQAIEEITNTLKDIDRSLSELRT